MVENPKRLDRILEKCLAGIEQGGWTVDECLRRYPELQGKLEPALRATLRLRALRNVRPSESFRAESPNRLNVRIQISRRPARIRIERPSTPRRPGILRWALPLIAAALIAVVGVAFAADLAKPGDLLFGIDRAMEALQLQYARGTDARARLHLHFASERLDEVANLIARGRILDIRLALDAYRSSIQAAAPLLEDGQALDSGFALTVSETLTSQERQLEELLEAAPTESQSDIEVAIEDVEVVIVVVGAPGGGDQGTPVGTPAIAATSTPLPGMGTKTPPPPYATSTASSTLTPTPTATSTPSLIKTPILPKRTTPTPTGGIVEPE